MPGAARTGIETECRQCCSFCDLLVDPSGCIDSGCRNLYLYDDGHTGARYMGCLEKVFKVEIDTELFRRAQLTRQGYGGVKLTGAPLPQCRVYVERAYHGAGAAFDCVNPGFFEGPVAVEAVDAAPTRFDLRDGL